MNIEMALKSRSYILDLDHIKLSLGLLFFSELFNREFLSPAFRIYFFFVKNTDHKAENLMFCLISPVAKIPAWFLEGQSKCLSQIHEKNINIRLTSFFFDKVELIYGP